jgi:hypothetical protein
LKNEGWKRLVGHQYDREKPYKVFSSSLFSALHSTNSFFPFSLHIFSFFFCFLTAINLLMFCFYKKYIYILLLVLLTGVLVFEFGGLSGLLHTLTFLYFR